MKINLFCIFLLFFCLGSCSSRDYSQDILIEKPTNLIVNKSDKTPYTGKITITDEKNTTFFGESLNGKKHKKCYWIKENGDTIQLQIYNEGDMIYSIQFDFNGERSTEWIKYHLEITSFDSLLIYNIFQIIEKSDFELLEKMIQQHQLPYAKLVENKISKLENELGELHKMKLERINKCTYNFRPEKYLEIETVSEFEYETIQLGIRLLEYENKLQTIEIWEMKPSKNISKSYIGFDIWSYLNL